YALLVTPSDSFFFQAEDGIRDRNVTGVQTCALPILTSNRIKIFPKTIIFKISPSFLGMIHQVTPAKRKHTRGAIQMKMVLRNSRSEERRVGKERRSRSGRSSYSKWRG